MSRFILPTSTCNCNYVSLLLLFCVAVYFGTTNSSSVSVTYDGRISDSLSFIKNGKIAVRFRRDTSQPVTPDTASNSTLDSSTDLPLNSSSTATVLINATSTDGNVVTLNSTGSPFDINDTTTENPPITSTSTLNVTDSSVTTPATASTTIPIEDYKNVSIHHDDRKYYIVSYTNIAVSGNNYWKDIDGDSYTHPALKGRNQALQIPIPWNFTYYGHDVNLITIGIGGFLYMSPFLHLRLTATQYIAPLMANFDSSIGDGQITYAINDEVLVVQWKNLSLHNQEDAGTFTFQAQLFRKDGKIVFVYKKLPVPLASISDVAHTVTVGIADAYYVDIGPFRTIYEYHNVSVDFERVDVETAIVFTHKKTCNLIKDCNSCHNDHVPGFQCYWCGELNRCSDTKDRALQAWYTNGCPISSRMKETCPGPTTTSSTTTTTLTTKAESNTGKKKTCVSGSGDCSAQVSKQQADGDESNAGLIAGIVVGVVLAAVIAMAVILYIYSYRNPTSVTGQLLIKYRPSQLGRSWNSRAAEDRYTVGSQVLANNAYEGDMY